MLIGRDLGFFCLALVIVLFAPVIGFVVRRKWRLAAARAEEVKRLLVLAAEESARAELEATVGYSSAGASDSEQLKYQWATAGYSSAGAFDSEKLKYQWDTTGYSDSVASSASQQLQYQCAVCFCSTTRRCARCKSVRYCSGECQIIHWRQGHKDNCYPVTTTHQVNDVGNLSGQKAFKQEEHGNIGNSFETEEKQPAKPVEIFPEESAFASSGQSNILDSRDDSGERNSTSDFTPHSFYKESSASKARNESSIDASVSISSGSNYENTNQNKHESVHSIKLNEIKPSGREQESQSGSSSSSGWSVDGSNDSTFSEPSTPSSGFWEGTLDSTLDSGEVILPRIDLHGSNGKRSSLDDAGPTTSEIKKPADEAGSSEELISGSLKCRKSPSHGSVKSIPVRSNLRASNGKRSSLDAAGPTTTEIKMPVDEYGSSKELSSSGLNLKHRKSPSNGSVKSIPVKSNNLVNDTSNPLRSLKSHDVGSLSSKSLDSEDSCLSEFVGNSKNVKNGLKTSMWKLVDQLRASKSSQIGNAVSTRYNYKGLFPYELFVYLYNWKEVELRPCGLINCGNSCYANAVLQCLAFTPPLSAYLLQRLHSKTCEKNDWCFTCEFESLILRTKEGNSPLSPVRILSRIQNIGSNLSNGREEDAHEFLRYAIDTMKSVCLKEGGTNASSSFEEETTLIDLTFGGYLRSKIRCSRCGGKSERNERMMDLTVEIEGDVGTLEAALRKFTGTEILDGENKYQCSRCKSYEKAKKKLTVLEAPNVLTIALKRFQSGKFGKLNKSIQFPEILDLAPYMSETSDTSPIYRLYGVVVHLDIMNAAFSGHYVCYVKNIQNKWFSIDDSTVKPVELERVLLSKGAYMLLYARCSPHAPKSIQNSIIPQGPRKPKNPIFKSRSKRTGDFYMDPSFRPIVEEEDSSSENSSSLFSESGSSSTDTSTRGSTSTMDDYFDQILGEFGRILNGQSDSDTSSSSSYPSPLYEYRESALEESESSKHGVMLGSSRSYRAADSDRLGQFYPSDMNYGVQMRRSTSERRD